MTINCTLNPEFMNLPTLSVITVMRPSLLPVTNMLHISELCHLFGTGRCPHRSLKQPRLERLWLINVHCVVRWVAFGKAVVWVFPSVVFQKRFLASSHDLKMSLMRDIRLAKPFRCGCGGILHIPTHAAFLVYFGKSPMHRRFVCRFALKAGCIWWVVVVVGYLPAVVFELILVCVM